VQESATADDVRAAMPHTLAAAPPDSWVQGSSGTRCQLA
jgi:hypothetical protein